jgi:hypothetical protein
MYAPPMRAPLKPPTRAPLKPPARAPPAYRASAVLMKAVAAMIEAQRTPAVFNMTRLPQDCLSEIYAACAYDAFKFDIAGLAKSSVSSINR